MSQPSPLDLDPVRAALDPLLGRLIGDRYRIAEEIGSGGMGRVYKALQVPLDRTVALKVLATGADRDETFSKRFFLEASTTARLSHPNTIAVYDYGCTPDGIFYIVMEYLNGRTLQETLQREGPLAQERVIHIAQQICRSLREAHELGIIHRDLKPANVMLLDQRDDHDFAKVLDFGLVKVITGDKPQGEITNRGSFVGSPHYMAPEQARDQNPDQRSDVYSLGVVLYHMLAGVPPFLAESSVDIILKHVLEPPLPLLAARPDLKVLPALEAIVTKCMAKEREQRYQSMDELLDDLKAVRTRVSGFPAPVSVPHPPTAWTQLPHTPHPETRTPSRAMASLPPPPPPDAFENQRPPETEARPSAPAALSPEWLAAFRALHERARTGALGPAEAAEYERDREILFNALLAAQKLSTKPGGRARKSMRSTRELPVRLVSHYQEASTRTLDFDMGGFAVFLDQPPRVGDRFEFALELGQGTLAGHARVVNVQKKGKRFRVGWGFVDLSPEDATRIHLEILDGVFSQAL